MKMRLGLFVVLACGAVCAKAPARAPMEWKSVNREAISAWKAQNDAPDGVAADASSRSVRVLAEATGLQSDDPAEFFAIGPLSDRAYESLFVTVASPSAIAAAIERAGIPRGTPPDFDKACLWPAGERITLSARQISTNAAAVLSFSDLVDATTETNLPVLYTGGQRDASGSVVAATNIPCAVFALYTHSPSLLLLGGQLDQSAAYGRFRARKTWPAGALFELTLQWDGRKAVLHREMAFTKANVKECIAKLRADADGHDLYLHPAFGEGVTVDEASALAQALSLLDGKGVKINGAAKGNFFYRSFMPEPSWRTRQGRIFQPFEVRVSADGKKTFTFVEEDWSGEGLDPVLKPKETPFKDWSELPGLVAKTGEQGAKINVLFIFAPASTPVNALAPILSATAGRIVTYYVFGE
ncbi:MAG: hypothetical protein II649_05320 [Kiritimatiellae bacterium]|nr:hypothetical protein [Kiritimatiellia bacterium]